MTEGLRIYHNNRRYVLDRVSIKTLSDEELIRLNDLSSREYLRRIQEKVGIIVRPEK